MKIASNYIDKLNGKITIEIDKKDYAKQVNSVLHKYSQTANVAGFRKGHVPMGLIKKQYGVTVSVTPQTKKNILGPFSYISDCPVKMR